MHMEYAIYEYAVKAVCLGEAKLVGTAYLLAELRSIRNMLEPFIDTGTQAAVKRKAQDIVDTLNESCGQ